MSFSCRAANSLEGIVYVMTSHRWQRNASKDGKIHPGQHLPLRASAYMPDGHPQSPPVALAGSLRATTCAYIFEYPFDVLVSPEVNAILDVRLQGEDVTIYPPFRSRTLKLPFVRAISPKTLPHRLAATAPDFDWLSAPVEIGTQPDDYEKRRQSLRIDIPRHLPFEFAEDIADSLIDLIRAHTNQWWIKRGRDHPRTNIRHWFEANGLGERLSGIGTFAFFYGKLGFERTMDSDIWNNVVSDLVAAKHIALSQDTFLDSVYFHASDDLRRCLLELGISNEVLLTEILDEWVAAGEIQHRSVSQLLGGKDYLLHLSRTGKFRGRSFEVERPTEFEWIKAIWIARGKLAHGRPPVAHSGRPLSLDDGPSIFASTIELRKWLAGI